MKSLQAIIPFVIECYTLTLIVELIELKCQEIIMNYTYRELIYRPPFTFKLAFIIEQYKIARYRIPIYPFVTISVGY